MNKWELSISMAFLLGLFGCVAVPSQSDGKNEKIPSWSGAMTGLQKNLSAMEEYIYDPNKFNDPGNRDFLKQQISEMAKQAENLTHNPTLLHRDPTVRFVANRFAEDVQRAHESFEEGKSPFARYQLMKVSSSCVQCHARMQQGAEFRWKKEETFLKNLSPASQVEFLIASRRFDQASAVTSKNLSEVQEGLNVLDLEKLAHLGLMITVQYQNDPLGASKMIRLIQKSSVISPFFRQQTTEWNEAIQRWKNEKKRPKTVADWRRVFQDRESEVEAMRVIPGVLEIMTTSPHGPHVGEALLLLGEAYEVINEILPMELHENYYAACIESVPHTSTSKKCFSKLSQSIHIGYSGSSGTHIPVEVEIWLEKLKKSAL